MRTLLADILYGMDGKLGGLPRGQTDVSHFPGALLTVQFVLSSPVSGVRTYFTEGELYQEIFDDFLLIQDVLETLRILYMFYSQFFQWEGHVCSEWKHHQAAGCTVERTESQEPGDLDSKAASNGLSHLGLVTSVALCEMQGQTE